MHLNLPLITKSLIRMSMMFIWTVSVVQMRAQVLLSGTSFEPIAGINTPYYSINDVKQYGLQTGTIRVTPALTPNTAIGVFNSGNYYAITDNPSKLDARYHDISAAPTYQLVVSPRLSNSSNILEYALNGLEPGTYAKAVVTYCSVISPTDLNCGMGANTSIKGIMNPDQFNTNNGVEGPLVRRGICNEFTIGSSGMQWAVNERGELKFYLNAGMVGPCTALSIKKIEIYGIPKFTINDNIPITGCVEEEAALSPTLLRAGSYQWQTLANGTWTPLGLGAVQKYKPTAAGASQFRYVFTPTGKDTSYVSDTLIFNAEVCCSATTIVNRRVLYHDDFGRLDLADKTGSTYKVWDYTDPMNPKEIVKTTTTPFRWQMDPAPLGADFRAIGPPDDGQYTVAAYLTSNAPYNGYQGALLSWANYITGMRQPVPISYDHSGKLEGGVLLLNVPMNTLGQPLYTKVVDNLCGARELSFECYITVFTNSAAIAGNPYTPVKINVRLIDEENPTNMRMVSGTATRQADGGGQWVKIQAHNFMLQGSKLKFEIINNQNSSMDGNDLVLDDIRVTACLPQNSPCIVTKTTDAEHNVIKTILKIYNVLGREVQESQAIDGMYLYQYTDGSSEKVLKQPQ